MYHERAIRLLSLVPSSSPARNHSTKSILLPRKMPYFQQVYIYHIKNTGKCSLLSPFWQKPLMINISNLP